MIANFICVIVTFIIINITVIIQLQLKLIFQIRIIDSKFRKLLIKSNSSIRLANHRCLI
jgi:hypothetical protein